MTHLKQQTKNADQGVRSPTMVDQGSSLETVQTMMATRYPDNGFYEYHKMFSAQAAAHLSYSGKKVDWSVRNKTLFCSIFTNSKARTCNLCQSSLHLSSFCPKLTENNAQARFRNSPLTSDMFGRVRMQAQGSEICINFNSARGCFHINCNYLHVCLICHKEYSQQACQESKKLKKHNQSQRQLINYVSRLHSSFV